VDFRPRRRWRTRRIAIVPGRNPLAVVSPVSGGASLARQWLDTGDANQRNRPFKDESHVITDTGTSPFDGRTGVGRRGRLWFAVGLIALAGTVAACGGGGNATRRSETSPSVTAPAVTLPSTSTPPASGAVSPPATTTPTVTTEVPSTTEPSTTEPETTTPTTESTTEPTVATTTEVPPAGVTPTSVEPHSSTTIIAQSNTNSTTLGWIIGGLVALLLVILAVVLIFRSRSRRRARESWNREAEPVLAQATMVRDRLAGAQQRDPAERAAINEQLESVTSSLTGVENSAPTDEAATAANVLGENLRGLSFAQEASDLLRSGPVPPSGEQLARADQASRAQLAQLDAALDGLRALVEQPGAT
jgi:hypothetical protein